MNPEAWSSVYLNLKTGDTNREFPSKLPSFKGLGTQGSVLVIMSYKNLVISAIGSDPAGCIIMNQPTQKYWGGKWFLITIQPTFFLSRIQTGGGGGGPVN